MDTSQRLTPPTRSVEGCPSLRALIQWLYSPRALRDAQNLRTDYADAALHARLMRVLNERLGHRLAEGGGRGSAGSGVVGPLRVPQCSDGARSWGAPGEHEGEKRPKMVETDKRQNPS